MHSLELFASFVQVLRYHADLRTYANKVEMPITFSFMLICKHCENVVVTSNLVYKIPCYMLYSLFHDFIFWN